MKTKRIELNARTYYLFNSEGEGTIVSSANDLDRVADDVAQHIGFPIQYGSWAEPDDTLEEHVEMKNALYMNFATTEECLADWKQGVEND